MSFDYYLKHWNLWSDGEPIITHSSQLLPVCYQGKKAMLKIAISEEERLGANLMSWWDGEGAAPVLLNENNALLMERALEGNSLVKKALHDSDDEASQIICAVATKLHAKKGNSPLDLIPLKIWFRALENAALQHDGIFAKSLKTANNLLNSPQDVVVLHGDLHHGNILDFGQRGWLAIDPKYITGERGFDFANIFCNPDKKIALQPGRLLRQVGIVSDCAQLERGRLLQWILAYAGLSAAWSLDDKNSPELALSVAELAAFELNI